MKFYVFLIILLPYITIDLFEESRVKDMPWIKINPQEVTFEDVKKMVNSQHFIFTPTTIRVKGGTTTTLTDYRNKVKVEGSRIEAYLEVILTKEIIISNRPFLDYNVTGTIENLSIDVKERREIIKMKFEVIPDDNMQVTHRRKMQFDFTFYKSGKTNLNLFVRGVYIPYTGYSRPLSTE